MRYIERLCYGQIMIAGILCYICMLVFCEADKNTFTLVRDQLDGLESYCSGKTTLNYAFDRYISTKYDLKEQSLTAI